jgi:hypothetical protein
VKEEPKGQARALVLFLVLWACPVTGQETVLIDVGEEWKYLKGTAAAPSGWRDLVFDDSSWLAGPTGIGYGDGDDATELLDMQNNYASFFCRKVFSVLDPAGVERLVLRIDYDDGFIAYLNGVEAARSANMGPAGMDQPHDFQVAASHEAGAPEDFQIDLGTVTLNQGANVLAVQVHNDTLGSSDASFAPTLLSGADARFRRGDANADGRVDVGDAAVITTYLFLGGDPPACLDAADALDDRVINITDPVGILSWLASGGSSPSPPGPFTCGGSASICTYPAAVCAAPLPRDPDGSFSLRLDVAGGMLTGAAGGVATWELEVDEAALIPVQVALVLESAITDCLARPAECDGAENFYDDQLSFYGCSSLADEDLDGLTDLEDPDCVGARAWSVSVETDGCFGIRSATTLGTLADLSSRPPGIRDASSFERSEVVDPARNGGREGAVSTVQLAYPWPIILPPVSESVVLILEGTIDATGLAPEESTPPCRLAIAPGSEPGLTGSSEPVRTVVTTGAETVAPELTALDVVVRRRELPEFRRGDANTDGRVDLADYYFIVAFLAGGPQPECLDAADADRNRVVDLNDAVVVSSYVLLGTVLPEPGLACGPGAEGISCERYDVCGDPGPRPEDARVEFAFVGPAAVARGETFDVRLLATNAAEVQALSLGLEVAGATVNALIFAPLDLDLAWASGPGRLTAGGPDVNGGVLEAFFDLDPSDGVKVLEPGNGQELLTLELTADSDPGCDGIRLSFVDGLPGFADEAPPTEVAAVVAGQSLRPVTRELVIPIARPLALGVGETEPVEQCALYRLAPPFTGKLVITLTGTDPDPDSTDANALYFAWGRPSAANDFDHAADERGKASQRLVVPAGSGEDAFILVQANAVSGGASEVELLVEEAVLALESVSATRSRSGARLHASIAGAGFRPETTFALEPALGGEGMGAGGGAIPGGELVRLSGGRVEAVFDLAAAVAGPYDLVARTPFLGLEARIPSAFEVVEEETAVGPRLEVELLGARSGKRTLRWGEVSRLTLRYRNTGDAEMPAPLFRVVALPGTMLRGAREGELQEESLQILGIHPGGVAGYLPPDGGWEVPIEIVAGGARDAPLPIEVWVLSPLPSDFVGWDELAPPGEMTAEDWEAAWPSLSGRFGASWASYRDGLGALARRLSYRGADASSVLRLFRFAVREALGRPSSAILGEARISGLGAALAGVPVLALEDGAVVASTVTDTQGAFALDWLAGGRTYELALGGYRITSPRGAMLRLPEEGDLLALEVEAERAPDDLAPDCAACDETGLPERPLEPPAGLFALAARWEVDVVSSFDPNEKRGPDGEERKGGGGIIPPDAPIEYTIHFENLPSATGPARRATVTDYLDTSVVDIDSVVIRDIGVGNREEQHIALDVEGLELASGYTRYLAVERYSAAGETEVRFGELPAADPLLVGFTVMRDREAGMLTWEFTTLSSDPDTGFLPANCREGCDCLSLREDGVDDTGCKDGRGQAVVSFSVLPLPDLPDDTLIENRAEIRFDGQPPEGPQPFWVNRIGRDLPPAPPRSLSPPDGFLVAGTEVELRWETVPGTRYDVHLWHRGAARDGPAASERTAGAFLAAGLVPGAAHVWQVVARNDHGETPGPERVFSVREAWECPPVPHLVAPADGAEALASALSFSWSLEPAAVPGEVVHDLFIWRAGEPEPGRAAVSGLLGTSFSERLALEGGVRYRWRVAAFHAGCEMRSEMRSFTVAGGTPFRRGDTNGDGTPQITDAIFLLNFLFLGGSAPPCRKSADTDDTGRVELTDAVYLLNFLFLGGKPPPAPFAACGPDPTADGVRCFEFDGCGGG